MQLFKGFTNELASDKDTIFTVVGQKYKGIKMMNKNTAVLVIDVQVGLIEGENPVYQGQELVGRIAELLAQAREMNIPVVYVQDKDVGGVGSPEWQIHPDIAPQTGELVVRKAYGDSFYQTQLYQELQQRGIQHLITVGCQTDACVDATCRRAIALGYDVTLVADGHSTVDNEFLTALQSIGYYNLVLDELGKQDGFGNGQHWITVKPMGEVLAGNIRK